MTQTTPPAAPRVAYQGEPGAFGEAAVHQRWGSDALAIGAPSFARTIELLVGGDVDAAVLPVWNSTIGPIVPARDALEARATEIQLGDEVAVSVQHALLALPGASLDSLRAVGSHPAALGQCARFLAEHPALVPVEAFDTAGAARELAALVGAAPKTSSPWYATLEGAAPASLAAIASETAATRHGLVVLARNIQDSAENETRFVVVRRRGHVENGA